MNGARAIRGLPAVATVAALALVASACSGSDDDAASEKPMTLPPSSSMAEVKLSRVRVEGS